MRNLLLAAALLIFPSFVWPARAQSDLQASNVSFTKAELSGSQTVIQRIEFSGLRRIRPDSLREHAVSRTGQPFDPARLEADVRALDRLGWFDSISAEITPFTYAADSSGRTGLRLVFKLTERPFLAGVVFQGSSALSPERIKTVLAQEQITLKVAAPANGADLRRAARAIQAALADLGHPRAKVHVRLEGVPTAAVHAVFEIDDGPRISAGRVTFTGNRAFSEATLLRQMRRVAPGALFAALRDKDVYTPDRLEQDLERLEDFYRNHGYPGARFGPPAISVEQDRVRPSLLWPRRRTVSRFHISIPVEEGPFYRLGAVHVNSDLAKEVPGERASAIPEITRLKPGEPYSQQSVDRAREALSRLRASAPSSERAPAPEVDVTQRLDPAAGTVQVGFRIREAHPYSVRRLEFFGAQRFTDRYYRRHIPVSEGDPFDPVKFESGLAQLTRAGFIRPIKKENIRVRFDEARHTADVAIRVEEIGRQKLSLVGGHAGLGSTAGLVYYVFNLLGGEELITAHIEGGPDSVQLLFNIAKEGLFGTRASIAFSLYKNFIRPNLPGPSGRQRLFTSRSSGLGWGLAFPVSTNDRLGATYNFARQSTQYNVPLPPELSGLASGQLRSSTSTSAFGVYLSHDTWHDRLNTDASVSGGWLGGSENLLRSSLEYSRVLADPLTERRNTWAFRGSIAGVSSFRGDLVFQERFFAGEQFVRGFRSGELAPYALVNSTHTDGSESFRAESPGADLVGAFNAEYRARVAARTEAAGFFDAGSGWLLPNWLGPRRPTLLAGTNGVPRASTGIELRWFAPGVDQTVRVHLAVNPWRLARTFLLPDGSRFHSPDRLMAFGWALGSWF